MALLGKSFNSYVDKQVKIRQKSLGGPSLTPETLKVYNSQSPWIRLASSVDITAGDTSLPGKSVLEQVKDLFDGFEYVGDKLAKNFVLFGGVNTEKGGVGNMPTGINKSPLKSAYGFGYKDLNRNNSRGYVPMPGIESVNFSYKNDGALAQASIQIKCFSPEQFQMIDILFQRPGYTVLLEFGHSVFKDNEGNIQYAGQGKYSYETEPFSNLYNPKEDQGFYNLLDLIQGEKEKWDGNYEAFYAKITKFNWKFNSDGSYNITVNLIGLGDVINSLKLNTPPPKLKIISKEEVKIKANKIAQNIKANPTTSERISAYTWELAFEKKFGKNGSQRENPSFEHNGYFYHYINSDEISEEFEDDLKYGYYKTNIVKYNEETFTLGESATIQNSLNSHFTYELRRIKDKMDGVMSSKTPIDDTLDTYISSPYPHVIGSTTHKKKEVIISNGVLGIATGNEEHDPGTYISFGVLLSMLQQFANQYSKGIPVIQFDFNFVDMGKDDNYIKKYPGLFSSDPTKILIPYGQIPSNIIGEGNKPLVDRAKNYNGGKTFNKVLNTSPFFLKDKNKGRLAYVYLHTDYLSEKYTESNNPEDGGILVLEFLKEVLKDIDSNLNNLNNFKVLHNKETNKIEIVSETPMSNTKKNVTIINTFGVTKTEGSFVRDLSLDSELSDDYATQISVGAQNNGLNSQSNSLSFSTYNKGLIDRMIPEKNDDGSIKSTTSSKSKKEKEDKAADYYMGLERNEDGSVATIGDLWGRIWTDKTKEVFQKIYISYKPDPDTLSSLKDLNRNISNFISGELTKKSLAPPPMFLPFNLKLTMDGLSGMKIYDSFEIDGKVLPASYNPEQIQLTVKSLSHKVDTNGWTTQVETFCQPKFTYDYTKIKVEEVPLSSPISPLASEGVYGEFLKNPSQFSSALDAPVTPDSRSVGWKLPVAVPNSKTSTFKINSKYGERWGKLHKGVDIRTGQGDPAYASADGIIVAQGLLNPGGYGNCIVIQHPEKGVSTIYAHMSAFAFPGRGKTLKEKIEVKAGQYIGATGGDPRQGAGAGRSDGPHLHYEIREGITENYGGFFSLTPINPANFGVSDTPLPKSPTTVKTLLQNSFLNQNQNSNNQDQDSNNQLGPLRQ